MKDPSKAGKGMMKAWGIMSRFSLILYLCTFAMAYIAFSRDQMEKGCFGFCDKLSTEETSHWSQSSVSKDSSPETTSTEARLLPSFSKGGVILFIHVPKTVRNTIRSVRY